MAILARGHTAINTETESTLHHDEVHLVVCDKRFVPGLLQVVQRSHMQSRKQSRRRPENEVRRVLVDSQLSE